jgi:hypothetical protein
MSSSKSWCCMHWSQCLVIPCNGRVWWWCMHFLQTRKRLGRGLRASRREKLAVKPEWLKRVVVSVRKSRRAWTDRTTDRWVWSVDDWCEAFSHSFTLSLDVPFPCPDRDQVKRVDCAVNRKTETPLTGLTRMARNRMPPAADDANLAPAAPRYPHSRFGFDSVVVPVFPRAETIRNPSFGSLLRLAMRWPIDQSRGWSDWMSTPVKWLTSSWGTWRCVPCHACLYARPAGRHDPDHGPRSR